MGCIDGGPCCLVLQLGIVIGRFAGFGVADMSRATANIIAKEVQIVSCTSYLQLLSNKDRNDQPQIEVVCFPVPGG